MSVPSAHDGSAKGGGPPGGSARGGPAHAQARTDQAYAGTSDGTPDGGSAEGGLGRDETRTGSVRPDPRAADSPAGLPPGLHGPQWRLHHPGLGGQEAWITAVGATLRDYRVQGRPLVWGFAADEACPDYRGKTLLPWPNRVGDGRWSLDGRRMQLARTEPDRANALHGLVCWQPWEALECGPSSLTCQTVLHPQPGWPWTLTCRVSYALSDEGLTVTPWVRNDSTTPAVFGYGAHPYLTAGETEVDELHLTAPGARVLQVDPERLLPTRATLAQALVPVDEGTDLRSGGLLGARRLDTAYTDLDAGPDGRWRVTLSHPPSGRRTCLWAPSRDYPWLQIFTGDALSGPLRRRSGVAIEPMTCGPDALRTGEGLLRLQPGEVWSAPWGLHGS